MDPSVFPSPSGLDALEGQGSGPNPTESVTSSEVHTGLCTMLGMEQNF